MHVAEQVSVPPQLSISSLSVSDAYPTYVAQVDTVVPLFGGAFPRLSASPAQQVDPIPASSALLGRQGVLCSLRQLTGNTAPGMFPPLCFFLESLLLQTCHVLTHVRISYKRHTHHTHSLQARYETPVQPPQWEGCVV